MYESGLEKLEHTIDKCSRLRLILEKDGISLEKIKGEYENLITDKRNLKSEIERLNLRKSSLESYAEVIDLEIETLLNVVQKFEEENFKEKNLFDLKTSKT